MRRPSSFGAKFCFSTKIGPRIERSSRDSPSGAWAAKNARCSFEKSFLIARFPSAASRTEGASAFAFSDAEHT